MLRWYAGHLAGWVHPAGPQSPSFVGLDAAAEQVAADFGIYRSWAASSFDMVTLARVAIIIFISNRLCVLVVGVVANL